MILEVKVTDEGIGISEQDQSRIFDNFFKTRNTESRIMNPYGNGIGLSLCKKICQSLDGDIEVRSHPNQGSEFRFTMKAFEVRLNVDSSQIKNDEIQRVKPP